MKLLNLGCGGTRPAHPWINVDHFGCAENNFVCHDLLNPLPFEADSIDGIMASHCLEHFNAQDAVRFLGDCRRVLKPGGVLRIGVPDASIFRKNYPEDNQENCPRIYGEHPIYPPARPSFLHFALFYDGDNPAIKGAAHMQAFSEDSLWCHFAFAFFKDITRVEFSKTRMPPLADLDNREKFTLFMEGVK